MHYHTRTKCCNGSVLPFRSDFLEERRLNRIVRWSFDATLVNISWWITGKEFEQISVVCFRDRPHMAVTFDMDWCSIRMKCYSGFVTHSCSFRDSWYVSITWGSHKRQLSTLELGTHGDSWPSNTSSWWNIVTDRVTGSWLPRLTGVSDTDMMCFLAFSVSVWSTCETK